MISNRSKGMQELVLGCQCVLASTAFWIWFLLWYGSPAEGNVMRRYLIYNEFMLLGLLVGPRPFAAILGVHTPTVETTGRRSFRQLGGTLFYLLLYLVAAQDKSISRLFFFSYIPLLYVILFATNRLLPSMLGKLVLWRKEKQRVLLIGPAQKALRVKKWLEQHRHLGLEITGLLSGETAEATDDDLPVLGRPEDLSDFLNAPGLTLVVLVEFPRGERCVRHWTSLCEERGIRFLVVADLDEMFGQSVAVFEDEKKFFLGLRHEPLQDPINRFWKRCLDLVVTLPVVLFVMPPLMLAAWLVQRWQSPGPLFFWQVREGLHNEPFEILKLRTMHVESGDHEKLPCSSDDPRLYPLGGILRKYSLDEIPQFWNVFRGDMSVVGPRPHLMSYNQQYRRIFVRAYVRSFVKPGITGLAQVRGFRGIAKTPEEIVGRMESDIEYLENWSLLLDCWLILRTVGHVLFPPKAAV